MTEDATIESGLWQGGTSSPDAALLAQYQLYVDSAERISDRRGLANTFFLTLHIAAMGFIAKSEFGGAEGLRWTFPVAGVVACFTWAALLRSYRTMNRAKFRVIGLMEKRLPASPFWGAEWLALGHGKDWSHHMPLGAIEMVAPISFAILYTATLVGLVTI